MGSQANRLESLDISKGIAIILMVLGHSSIPQWLGSWIYSFHMPFFFIISGMLTKWDGVSIKDFVLRKTKTLMFPFLIYSIINWLLIPFYKEMSLSEAGWHILLNGWEGLALWFIPVLYTGLIVVKCLPKRVEWVFVILILIMGILLSKYNIRLPWTISTIPVATFFIFIGRKAAVRTLAALHSKKTNKFIVICLLSFAGGWGLSQVHTTDLAWNNILPFSSTLVAAVLGSIFLFTISMTICYRENLLSNVLSFIGKHTFVIVAFSQVFVAITNQQFPTFNPWLKYSGLVIFLWLIIYFQSKVKNLYHAHIHYPHTTQG